MSLSEEIFSTYALRKGGNKKNNTDSEQSTSYEVFRNKTTAVEVIVKEVGNKKTTSTQNYPDVTTRNHFQQDIDKLKNDLNKANSTLENCRKCFQVCMFEMKQQLDSANRREVDISTKYVAVQLENEKLKTCLSSKTKQVKKLMRELSTLKSIIKSVVKNIANVPRTELNVFFGLDLEYNDFENNLKKDSKSVKFDTNTLDSTISKGDENN